MKKILPFLPTLLLFLSCVNPIDRTPVKWNTVFDLPIMNREFSFGAVLKENTDSTITLQGINTPPRGDTLGFFFAESTSVALSQQLCSFSPVTFNRKVETITIRTSDSVNTVFSFTSNPQAGPVPLLQDVPVTASIDKTVPSVYSVLFDTACPDFPLTIRNVSGATLAPLIVQVLDHGNVFVSDTIDTLLPNAEVIKQNHIRGKSIDSVLTYAVQTTLHGGAGVTLQPGDGLFVGFCLNGMTITHAVVEDTIAMISNRYLQPMIISDSINLHSIDISSVQLDVSLSNGVDENFAITGEWLDLWDIDKCNADSVFDHSALGKLTADSALSSRKLLIDTMVTSRSGLVTTIGSAQHNSRLFPVWDATGKAGNDSASVSMLALSIRSVAQHRRITIDENDTVSLRITPRQTGISGATGVTRYPISMAANRITKAINIPGLTKDHTLRNRLLFNGALLTGKIRLGMDSASSIDSCSINLGFSTPAPVRVRDTVEIGLQNLHNSARYDFSRDISPILDAYPDTLTMYPTVVIPANAGLSLHSSGTGDSADNAISLRANLNYGIRLPLNFTVADTASVFIADSARIGNTSDIQNQVGVSAITMHFKVRNTSGVALCLYGVAAPATSKRTLFNLSGSELNPTTVSSRYGTELFNLTGDSGLVILSGDSLKDNAITLTKSDFDKFITADTLFMRWNLRFLPVPGNKAVIRETDKVTIKASSHIEGIQRMDSLLHAGN